MPIRTRSHAAQKTVSSRDNIDNIMALKVSIPQFTEIQSIRITGRDFFYVSNILSASRLLAVPLIFYFIYRQAWIAAIVCGTIAAITDLLDGFFARRLKQHTELGYILDPIADKLALSAGIFALVIFHSRFPMWAFLMIVVRDILIMLGNIILVWKAKVIARSNFWGKCTSCFLSIVVLLYLLRPVMSRLPKDIEFYGLCLALVFVFISTVSYARQMFRVLETRSPS